MRNGPSFSSRRMLGVVVIAILGGCASTENRPPEKAAAPPRPAMRESPAKTDTAIRAPTVAAKPSAATDLKAGSGVGTVARTGSAAAAGSSSGSGSGTGDGNSDADQAATPRAIKTGDSSASQQQEAKRIPITSQSESGSAIATPKHPEGVDSETSVPRSTTAPPNTGEINNPPSNSERATSAVEANKPIVIGNVDQLEGPKLTATESLQPIEKIVPAIPVAPALPEVKGAVKIPDDRTMRNVLAELIGTWKQSLGGSDADFVEGGYQSSELTFTQTGMLQIVRTFDSAGNIRLTREVDFVLKTATSVSLGTSTRPGTTSLMTKQLVIEQAGGKPIVITPAKLELPRDQSIQIQDGQLFLGGKTYRRLQPVK